MLRVYAVSFCLLSGGACGPHASGAEMEAGEFEVYIRAICEDRYARVLECSELVPVPERFEEFSVQGCVEVQAGDYLEDPCFAEQDEFFRCRHERLSCSEYFGQDIDTSPGSVCYEFYLVLGTCVAREG